MRDIILYFANKYFGDWERIYDAIELQEDVDFDLLEELKEEQEGSYVTVLDEDYPQELKLIERPPFVLFFKGKKELLTKRNKYWYFGTYSKNEFKDVMIEHKKQSDECGLTLVSGYSSEFEKSYLNTISVKGMVLVKDSGIESYINMTKIEETHFIEENIIVSEYPNKVTPSLYTWEMSGRIKSGLSRGMCLLNTLKERLTFKLISSTIDQQRKVYCYNEIIDSESHNSVLVSKGAYAITNMKQIKEGN